MIQVGTITYKKIRELGAGQGMNSRVFLCNDLQLNGVVAVKEIPKVNLGTSFQEYFAEARAMFASSHPHVVPIRTACELPDLIGLVMPYYRNGSLTDRIRDNPVSLKESIRILLGILNGLERIHSVGHIHFDIKPSNVMFSDHDAPMIADFGQSRSFKSNGTVMCPPMYPTALPPEFFLHGIGTVHSDIYQAGLTLYRALNGDDFYKSQIPNNPVNIKPMTLVGKFPHREKFLPHVPKALRRIVRRAIKVLPEDRYNSAPEFADALTRVEIKLNWEVEMRPNEEIEFRAIRQHQSTLVVRLQRDNARWKYEMYTLQGTSLRAKSKNLWKTGLSRPQALKSLQALFEFLE